MAAAEALTTSEEFGRRPDPGHPEELIRGRVVGTLLPDRGHGHVCGRVVHLLGAFVEEHGLGRMMINGSGVITGRNPDSVRGADVAYYSFDRLPRGPLPAGYGTEVPELVVEVRSAGDRWGEILEKVAEYLAADVLAVVVLDPKPSTAHVFGPTDPPIALGADDELALPGILEGFRVRVGRFFE